MKVGLNRKRIIAAFAIPLFGLGAFLFGFDSSLHMKSSAANDVRRQYLVEAGDAPPAVRAGVLVALRAFQEGYVRRDPKQLDPFMSTLFSKNDDVLLMGTDANEWARGYPAVSEFIQADWRQWGDFRFAVDDSIISSAGDVAWIASVGVLHTPRADRPVRFSAILTRNGDRWLFRQVHFQWDDRDPSPSDLFHPSTHLRIANLLVEQILRAARNAGTLLPLTASK